MLVECFEGPAKAQKVFSKVIDMTMVIGEVPADCRVMFIKGCNPAEVLEEFLQTLSVVMEKDAECAKPGFITLVNLLKISNQGVSGRCLVQLQDMMMASGLWSEIGSPILLDFAEKELNSETTDLLEKNLICDAIGAIETDEVKEGLGRFLNPVMDSIRASKGEMGNPEAMAYLQTNLKVLSMCAEDTMLIPAMSKFKLFKDIVEIMNFPELKYRRENQMLTQADHTLLSTVYLIVGRTASANSEAAAVFVRAGVHLDLMNLIRESLEDADALRLEETWITIGERVACISGLCKDATALEQAMDKGFLDQLVVILDQDSLPLILISTTYQSLLQILEFAVPDHYSKNIDPTWKKQVLLDGTHQCIKDAAAMSMVEGGEEWQELNDHSKDVWMLKRAKINEVLDGVVPLLEYLGGTKYEALCQKFLGEVVPLSRITFRPILDVMASIADLLAYFGARATKVTWVTEREAEKEDTGWLADSDDEDVVEMIKTSWLYVMDKDAFMTCRKLNDADRDGILFNLLQVPDDTVKLAAVTTLSLVPLDEFSSSEVAAIVKMVADIDDVSAGRTEEIISVLLSILTKLAKLEDSQGMEFRKRFSRSVFVVMDILKAMTANDVRSSETNSKEKDILCTACIDFLQAASLWKEAPAIMRSKEAISAMKIILLNEDRCGDEARPALIEATGVGGNAQSLLKALAEQVKTGSVYARILNRISALMEGPVAAKGYPIEVQLGLGLWLGRLFVRGPIRFRVSVWKAIQ